MEASTPTAASAQRLADEAARRTARHRRATRTPNKQSPGAVQDQPDQPTSDLQGTLVPDNRSALAPAVSTALQREVSNPTVTRLRGTRITLQRQAPPDVSGHPPATYNVGGNAYKDDQWNVAVTQVAGLWTDTNGILAKRKEAVDAFCGPGGAGAKQEGSLTESLLQGAMLALFAAAVTDWDWSGGRCCGFQGRRYGSITHRR